MDEVINVVSFSGGKDSTAMLLMMLEKNIPVDRVICVDTTKEFPAMYRHVAKVQEMIEPLKIEVVKSVCSTFLTISASSLKPTMTS